MISPDLVKIILEIAKASDFDDMKVRLVRMAAAEIERAHFTASLHLKSGADPSGVTAAMIGPLEDQLEQLNELLSGMGE